MNNSKNDKSNKTVRLLVDFVGDPGETLCSDDQPHIPVTESDYQQWEKMNDIYLKKLSTIAKNTNTILRRP